MFSRLTKDRMGRHQVDPSGVGHERAYETKPYEFGDPFNLNIERTVRNALQRTGGGTPVRLSPDDFEVERTETLTRSSTVLMVDLSLSMPMRQFNVRQPVMDFNASVLLNVQSPVSEKPPASICAKLLPVA